GSVLRQQRRRDFDMIQERRLSRFFARLVQSFQHESPARQAGASRQKQEERQDHRDVDRNGAECVSCDRIGLAGRKLRLFVVALPRALVAETKAASQNISIAGSTIKHTDGQSTSAIWGGWILAHFGIEIKVGFHAAREHIQFRVAMGPKALDQAAPALRGRLNKSATPSHRLRTRRTGTKSVAVELLDPRRFAPFNPHALARY